MENKYLITVLEASKRFSLGRDRIYSLIRSEVNFPVLKVGNKYLINVALMDAWVDRATLEGSTL